MRTFSKLLPRLSFFGLFACLAVVGCDSDKSSQSSQTKKQGMQKGSGFVGGENAEMFTFAMSADPETFDTGQMSGAPEGQIAVNIFEGLMAPGPTTKGVSKDEVVRKGMAKSYKVSDDKKTYTFKIRKDAKWSNGEPVTSGDFEYAWKRVLDPEFPADYTHLLYVIDGAQKFNENPDSGWDSVGVETPDKKTIKVTLENPTPYFLELLAFYTFYPVPKDIVEKHGDKWTNPQNIVTNGAYTLAEYEPQRYIRLNQNSEYWDKSAVSIDKAKVRIIADTNAVVNAYKAGELHWTGGTGLPIAQITSLITHPDYYREPMLGNYFFRVNVSEKDSPLSNPKVRKALSLAIDRSAIVNSTLNGLYKEANSFVPENMPGYTSKTNIEYDVAKAKQLLKEAGYPEGKDFPDLELLYNTDKNHKLLAESVQGMWKRNLGINIDLINKEWKTYLQAIDTLKYEIGRAGWIGDYNDPMTFLKMWTTGNGNNDTGWSNKKYDSLIDKAKSAKKPAKRKKMLHKAEEILLETGPVIPIYFYTNHFLVSQAVEGFQQHNRGIHLLKYLSLKK